MATHGGRGHSREGLELKVLLREKIGQSLWKEKQSLPSETLICSEWRGPGDPSGHWFLIFRES